MKFKDIQKLLDLKFRRLTGVSWATFNLMLAELNKQLPRHIGKGRPHKLPLEDRLLLCIEYWREYRTFFHLGMSYGVSETSAIRITRIIKDALIRSGKFNLPKQLPDQDEVDWEVVVIDTTEILVQRPKKQKKWYSGKKKRYTFKFQLSMHYTTCEILSVCGSHGSMHDFKIFKKSMKKLRFKPFFIVDKRYLEIKKLGFRCLMPSKAKKTEKLDSQLKKLNKEIGRRRIQVEPVFGRLKCFKILSCVYRNRRKRLNLRFNLLTGIYNLDWVKDKQLN